MRKINKKIKPIVWVFAIVLFIASPFLGEKLEGVHSSPFEKIYPEKNAEKETGSKVLTEEKSLIPATIIRVIDGDSVVLNIDGKEKKARLIGVDTPESVHPKKEKNTAEGKEASDFVKGILLSRMKVQLEYDAQSTDKYGRELVYLYLPTEDGDKIFFNEYLISMGYAKTATFPPNVKYADHFASIQKEAQKAERGFWKDYFKN